MRRIIFILMLRSPTSPASYKRARLDEVPRLSPVQSTLEKLLSEKGHCYLNYDHASYIISNSHQLQWHLDRRLKADPELLKQLLHDLSILFEDDSVFRKALRPSVASAEEEECLLPAGHTNPSLVRVLLGVPCLQEHVFDAILQKLPEFAGEQDCSSLCTDIPRLIVHQLQFLDSLYNETRFCEKLLELFDVCQVSLQKDILSAIPDILSDASHSRIVEALQAKLQEDVTLTVNILDTLSNLDLQADMMESVRNTALKALETSPISDLPIVIRFIMQSSTKKIVDKTMEDVLKKLRCVGVSYNNASKTSTDDFLLILEQIKIGLAYHKHIASAMMKCLQKIDNNELCPVAVWVALILNDQSVYSNRIIKIVRKWISTDNKGTLPKLFEKFINDHIQALDLVAKSILFLAEETIRSSDTREQDIGDVLYRSVLHRFDSRHLVVSCLATHIGSGRTHEIDRALQILFQICTARSNDISPYFAYLLGLLDYCHNLSNFQLRILFKALAKCHSSNEGNIVKSDIVNYITKNLQFATLSFQRPAIIGALCLINAYVPVGQEIDEGNSVFPLFEDLKKHTNKSHVATTFLCEEILFYLNRGNIAENVAGHLIERVIKFFMETFLISPESQRVQNDTDLIHIATLFSLNLNEDRSIAIYPGLADPSLRPAFIMLPTLLELLYRWSQCEPDADPDDDGFSSIPLCLFDLECLNNIGDFDARLLTLTFSSLVHAINWFRALLNAFACNSDDVLRWKCSKRVSQILEIQRELCGFPLDFVQKVVPHGISQSQRAALFSQKDIKNKKSSDDMILYRIEPLLRPFAPTVFSLLTLELKLELSPKENNEINAVLYLDSFHYLLAELHDILKRNSPKASPFKFPNQTNSDSSTVEHFDYFEFFTALNYATNHEDSKLRVFRALGKSMLLLTSRESAHSNHSQLISRNVELILQLMELILNCSVMRSSGGHIVLSMIIMDFTQNDFCNDSRIGLSTCFDAFGHFLLDLLPLPNSSINIQTKICSIINDLLKRGPIDRSGLANKLSDCALKLLTDYWEDNYSLDNSIGALISYHIKNSSNSLDIVQRLITSDVPQFFDRRNDSDSIGSDRQPTFSKTLTLATWPYFFKACAEQISGSMNIIERDVSSLLKKLEDCAKLFSNLLEFVKRSQKPAILGSALRFGQVFMDRIVGHLPLMKSMFKENKEEVIALINTVPKSTRILQRICSHVKREKISNLTGLLPALKKSMEKNMYLVKDLFHYHGMLSSADFKCGALKNRTIDGREIRSSDEEEEQQEEPNEPEDVEEADNDDETREAESEGEPTESPSEFHC